jgi:hypothetical protein
MASRRTGTAQPNRSRAIACNSRLVFCSFAFGCSSVMFYFFAIGLSSLRGKRIPAAR